MSKLDEMLSTTEGAKKIEKLIKTLDSLPDNQKAVNVTKSEKVKPPKKKTKYWYIVPSLNIITSLLLVLVGIFLFKSVWFTVLVGLLSVPIILLSASVFFVRLYIDKDKIKYKVGTKVSKSFISCRFLQANRRWKRLLIRPNHTDFSLEKGNEVYIIDSECIYHNEDNYPQIDYIEGIPMPINYTALWDKVKIFLEAFQNDNLGLLAEEDKELIELSFSAENLRNFKKDKVFREFHTSTNDLMKVIGLFVGLIFAICITFVLMVIFLK